MSGISQAAAGVGGLIGLGATDAPKNPFGSLGGTIKQLANTVVPITGGGMNIGFNSTQGDPQFGFYAQPTKQRTNTVNALSGVYTNAGNELGGMRAQVAPGFGRLTDAVVQTMNNNRQRAISNLSDELGRRRILGSSFGADTLARAEREFADKETEFRSKAFLAELSASVDLLNQQTKALAMGQQVKLDELNLETELAFKLGTGLNGAITQASNAMQQMMFEYAAGENAATIGALSNIFGGVAGAGTTLFSQQPTRMPTQPTNLNSGSYSPITSGLTLASLIP